MPSKYNSMKVWMIKSLYDIRYLIDLEIKSKCISSRCFKIFRIMTWEIWFGFFCKVLLFIKHSYPRRKCNFMWNMSNFVLHKINIYFGLLLSLSRHLFSLKYSRIRSCVGAHLALLFNHFISPFIHSLIHFFQQTLIKCLFYTHHSTSCWK